MRLTRRVLVLWIAAILLHPVVASAVVLGDFIVADQNANNGSGALIVVDPNSGGQAVLSSSGYFVDPSAVIAVRDGSVLVADREAVGGNGAIIRVDVSSGAQSLVTSNGLLVNPIGLALSTGDEILVLDEGIGSNAGKVIKVSPGTGAQVLLTSGGSLDVPSGIVVAGDGFVYVAVASIGIVRIDPTTGAQTLFSSGAGFHPFALALTGTGELLATDLNLGSDWNLVAVNLADGTRQFRSALDSPAISNAVGVAALLDGSVVMVDSDAFHGPGAASGGVFAIDTMTGSVSPLASGGEFRRPVGVCVYGVKNGATPARATSWGRLKDSYHL